MGKHHSLENESGDDVIRSLLRDFGVPRLQLNQGVSEVREVISGFLEDQQEVPKQEDAKEEQKEEKFLTSKEIRRKNFLEASEEEIFGGVREVLMGALGVDDDEVTLDATLVGDLGAESIDFLDITFRLETQFDVKIPRDELFPENITPSNEESSYVEDGRVTTKGITELQKRMPHTDVDSFAENPKVEHVGDLFTVQMVVNYCMHLQKKMNSEASKE